MCTGAQHNTKVVCAQGCRIMTKCGEGGKICPWTTVNRKREERRGEKACAWGDRMKPDNLRSRIAWTDQRSPGVASAELIGILENHGKTIIM